MRQQVGSVALNLGSREGVGFDMGVGKMVSHFQAVKPSTEHFPGEKFSGRMEGRDEKGHRVKEISSFFFFLRNFILFQKVSVLSFRRCGSQENICVSE